MMIYVVHYKADTTRNLKGIIISETTVPVNSFCQEPQYEVRYVFARTTGRERNEATFQFSVGSKHCF